MHTLRYFIPRVKEKIDRTADMAGHGSAKGSFPDWRVEHRSTRETISREPHPFVFGGYSLAGTSCCFFLPRFLTQSSA